MNTAIANPVGTSPSQPAYTATVLCSPTEISQLAHIAGKLLEQAGTVAQPDFFLASLTTVWQPRVVVIKQHKEVVAVVYARERIIATYPTGILHLDTTLGSMPVAESCHRTEIFFAALESLSKRAGARALRLIVPPEGAETQAIQTLFPSAQFEVSSAAVDMQHRTVALGPSYEAFLQSLGKQTRRNFRYYRRRFETEGHSFDDHVSLPEFVEAASLLLQEDIVGIDSVDVDRSSEMFKVAKWPLLVGLRHRDGRWLSILGGWYEKQRAVVFTQVNSDKEYAHYSLSSVLRAYLCEKLISEGIKEVVFWGGVVGPMHRYSEIIPGICFYVDKTRLGWRIFRRAVRFVNILLPRRMSVAAQWIVPIHKAEVESVQQ